MSQPTNLSSDSPCGPTLPVGVPRFTVDEYDRRIHAYENAPLPRFVPWVVWVAVAMLGVIYLDGRYRLAFEGIWAVLGLLLLLLGMGRRRSVPWTLVVVDKHINTQSLIRSPTRGKSLFVFMDELCAVARSRGLRDPKSFFERLREGAACHEPEDGIALIDALLSEPTALPDPVRMPPELLDLRSRLVNAQSEGARFCFMQPGGWSGAAETNLKLYWG